ncbi:MAG TPA: 50S ribosomal protein L4 [Bacilli bacterium]|nr:50S ribosomal protein L4 [Bacilli bacterium]
MTKIKIKSITNEVARDLTLNDSIWNIEVNDTAIKKAIALQLAATRQGTAKTKTRAEVSGGGRKPWKQKGTGRARQGSTRAVQWRGGGIAFGVTPRDYTFKINKKIRVLALKSALATKVNNKELVVVDSLNLDSLKTKDFTNLNKTLGLKGKILFVTADDCENLYMATRNIAQVNVILAQEINVYDIINCDTMVCDEAAIKVIEEALI